MDRFVKRPADKPAGPSSSKRSKQAKQGNVTALTRVAEFGKSSFYADNGKLFCRACNLVVDHTRKNTLTRHLESKVNNFIYHYYLSTI